MKQAEQERVENIAKVRLEKRHMLNKRTSTYIALEEMDFTWSTRQVKEFDSLWEDGYSLEYIAEYFNRALDEAALLLMDRVKKNKLKANAKVK